MKKIVRKSGSLRWMLVLLILALLCPVGAAAEDTATASNYTTNTSAVFTDLSYGYDQLTIETYLTGEPVEEATVKPCDIIFVLDQSRAMNGTQGDTREAIIEAMASLLDDLAEPTDTSAQHRVAIAGYGRVNVNEYLDAYSEADYPGVQHKGSGISLNTGYYTTSGFVSSNGWTEVRDSTSAELPAMPTSYRNSISYDSAFMTLAEAKTVLTPETMLAWYSGASRMDAGLTLAEQLADVAKAAAEAANADRNLIVCVVASSLPIQNYNSHNVIRDQAVQTAAEQLHGQGATIFALGDYKNSGRNLAADTEEHFQEVMTGICGSNDILGTKKEDYFFSLSKSGSITEALNQMITQITITVAESIMQDATVQVRASDVESGTPAPTASDYSAWLGNIPADTEVQIAYYDFQQYAKDGTPQFESEPYAELYVPLSELTEDGMIQYQTKLVPIQTQAEAAADQDASNLSDGDMVVITIVNPVTLKYQWVGDAPADAVLPQAEHVAYGSDHTPSVPETEDSHYEFADWYTDPACTKPVDSSFSPKAQVTTLYGKWTKYALVRFYEALSHTDEDPDEVQWVKLGSTPTTYTPTHTGYQFAGWYTDKACTAAYTPTAVTADLDLYAKWTIDTYHISVHVVDGTATPLTSPITVEHGSDQTIQFAPNDGYTLESVTVDGQVASLTAAGTYTFSHVSDNHSIQVVYTEDQNGDNIPDKYQVFVSFISADTTKGTVTDQADAAQNTGISQVYTLTDESGGYVISGSVTPTTAGIAVTPATGYALDIWTKDGSPDAVSPTNTWPDVQGGSTITLTAHFDTDTVGGENGGDGIPDKYQAIITYKIENGTWDGSSRDDKTYVFSLREKGADGAWVERLPTLGTSLPTGMQPDASHSDSSGTWDHEGLSAEMPVTENKTYTFYYGALNTYTIDVTVIDGTSDPAGPSISVEHGSDQTIQFTPNDGYTLDSVTVDSETASLDAQGKYSFQNVSQNHTIHVVYVPDENQDGIPDKDQVFVRFESADQTKGTVTGNGTFQAFPLSAGEATCDVTPSLTDVTVAPAAGYALDIWTKDGGSEAADPTEALKSVPGGTTITFRAHFDTDTLGGENGGDGIPDKYQVTVIYDPNNGQDSWRHVLTMGGTETISAAPERTGYEFQGWTDGADIYFPGDTLTVQEDILLEAVWVAAPEQTVPVAPVIPEDPAPTVPTYYTLTYVTNGGTDYPAERYPARTTVTLDKVPVREGHSFTGWYADEALTEPITDIRMTSHRTVYAGWEASTVPDLLNSANHFAYIIGYPDDTVRPDDSITRAEIATIFFRLLKEEVRDSNLTTENPFTDVDRNDWYCKAVSTLTALGITTGRTETTFEPDLPITRAELATICARFDTGITGGSSNFTDIAGHWAQADIEKAAALGWVLGDPEGTFRPDDSITRAEAVTMINRVLCRIPETEEDLLENMKVWPDNRDADQWYYLAVQEATNSHDFTHKGDIYETWVSITSDPDWKRYEN